MKRHDLIYIRPAAWRALLEMRHDLAAESIIVDWIDSGWPLIGRRAMPDEAQGVPLGLPLPPFAGKRRLSFILQPEDIISTAPPPSLSAASEYAPQAWWPTLDRLAELAAYHAVQVRVFGSLAWKTLTELEYLHNRSDLDLLLLVDRDVDIRGLTAGVAAIEAAAPMRLDGELLRDDGAAVNWREFHAGAGEVLVKTIDSVALRVADHFLAESNSL
jgi:phosphoribosyl-dephospho-CoA transferase